MAATQKTTKKKPARSTDRRNIWLLIITTLLVLGSVFMFMPPQEKINQGLDIQGGLSVVLTAKSTDGADVTNDDMEKSRAIIESRVNALGASEAVVQVQGTDQILVQIPGLTNTEDALNTIGKTGKQRIGRTGGRHVHLVPAHVRHLQSTRLQARARTAHNAQAIDPGTASLLGSAAVDNHALVRRHALVAALKK